MDPSSILFFYALISHFNRYIALVEKNLQRMERMKVIHRRFEMLFFYAQCQLWTYSENCISMDTFLDNANRLFPPLLLFSPQKSSWDAGRHKARQFSIVSSQMEQTHCKVTLQHNVCCLSLINCYTLTSHFNRYTLLAPGWTHFAFRTALILGCINSSRY